MAIGTGQLRFGPDNGRLLLHTGRSGVGSTVGHDLTIEAMDWSVLVDVPGAGVGEANITARVELGSLVVRVGAGGMKPLSDKDRAEIVSNARRTLDVDRHPAAEFASTRIAPLAGATDRGTISGNLTLRGVTAPLEVRVEPAPDGGYRATATVTQTAHGIKPYSAFLGALKVRDDVAVEVLVRAPG